MISLHISIYTDEEQDRYVVQCVGADGDVIDITNQYEVAACEMPDGRVGTLVMKREKDGE